MEALVCGVIIGCPAPVLCVLAAVAGAFDTTVSPRALAAMAGNRRETLDPAVTRPGRHEASNRDNAVLDDLIRRLRECR